MVLFLLIHFLHSVIKIYLGQPWPLCSFGWSIIPYTKGWGFHLWSGHTPRLWVQFPVAVHMGSNQCFSHIIRSTPIPLSLKSINICLRIIYLYTHTHIHTFMCVYIYGKCYREHNRWIEYTVNTVRESHKLENTKETRIDIR